jgi:hypothetical protein
MSDPLKVVGVKLVFGLGSLLVAGAPDPFQANTSGWPGYEFTVELTQAGGATSSTGVSDVSLDPAGAPLGPCVGGPFVMLAV